MRTSATFISIILVISGFAAVCSAKAKYNSNMLLMKNSDEIAEMVTAKIKQAQKIQAHQSVDLDQGLQAEPEAVAALTDALRIILARPDQDGTRGDLFSQVRHELQDLNSFGDAVTHLVHEGINTLKDSSADVDDQGTYVTILNNLLAEIQTEVATVDALRKTAEEIKDAHIKVSTNLKNRAFNRSTAPPVSPSDTAKEVLSKNPRKDSKGDSSKDKKKK
jgi:hypothetical protein